MATCTNNHVTIYRLILTLATILLTLVSLLTPATGYKISGRIKRDTLTIGDLPQIKPPVIARKGEPKHPSPGWTHCIKYLKADVRWRSIRSVNLKKLQTTQFQCSWFIESEVPGTQIRIAFERMELGNPTSTCTQQFLELIDIAAGKSQGRFCGEKRLGDYVTVGKRVRIDIQGEEQLVEKVRSGSDPPFIISYKIVREPAGFRINQHKSDVALRNKVKQTVGSGLDKVKTKTIYGSKTQPGRNDGDDTETGRSSSLTIWQVVIIVVVCTAIIACFAGVLVKRKIFDKRKKKEYLDMETNQDLILSGGSSLAEKKLPGLVTTASLESEKKSPSLDGSKSKSSPKQDEKEKKKDMPRSTSGPGERTKKGEKTKRHSSHDDARSYENVNNVWSEKLGSEAIISAQDPGATMPPKSRSAAQYRAPSPESKNMKRVTSESPCMAESNDTPSNRPTNRQRREPSKPDKKIEVPASRAHRDTDKKKRRKSETDQNKNHIKHKREHKVKTNRRKADVKRDVTRKNNDVKEEKEVKTPASRAQKVTVKRKTHTSKENGTKQQSESKQKTSGDKKRKETSRKDGKPEEKHTKSSSKSTHKNPASGTRRKTVSGARKKTSAKEGAAKGASANGHSKNRSRKPHSDGKHERSEPKKRKSNHTKTDP